MAWWIFQNLVITTALAAAVAVVCRVARVGPVARHALWVLVLIKFITPPLVVWPWAAPDPLGLAALDPRGAEITFEPIELRHLPLAEDAVAPNPAIPRGGRVPEDGLESSGRAASSVWPWLLALWALGSVSMLAVEGLRLVRLSRRRRPMSVNHPAAKRVLALAAQLDVRPVQVDMVDSISSPVVWGWGRPRLLWPSALDLDETHASLDGIVVHELAHIKRGDHFVGWIELLAGVVWWWNPLFWSVRSARREQAELACDAWVISALPNGRRAYAESLLLLSGAMAPDPSPMTAVGIRPGSRRVLERRLVMIMKGRSSLRLHWVGLCCLALVAAATLPAWASALEQAPPPPPAPPVPGVVITQAAPPPPPPPAPAAQAARKVPPPPQRVPVPKAPAIYGVKIPPPQIIKGSKSGQVIQYSYFHKNALPEDGQKLLESLDADTKAIQEEANQKMEARREAAVKALEALQDQYTKAGKLDEAVAVRDFLRAGGPAKLPMGRYVIRR